MIFGIGNDIISLGRIEGLMLRFKEKFEEKIFSKNEILKANQLEKHAAKKSFYAKRFAAKEAFSKALGLGIGRGINFTDIEVSNNEFGKPQIEILNGKMDFILQHCDCKKLAIHLSLSDEKKLSQSDSDSIASAFVIIEKVL